MPPSHTVIRFIIFLAITYFTIIDARSAEMIFRARIQCINDALEVSTLCFTNGKGHYDAEGNFYEPRLMTSFNMERHVFSDGATAGGSETALGAMEIENLDGALDSYKEYGFDGRSVVLEAAPKEDGAFRTVWKGQASFAQFEYERVMIFLRDRQEQLYNRKVQEALYEGEDQEIEGTPVPQCYGKCLNVSLTPIDSTLMLYQCAESLKTVVTVYDSGAKLSENIVTNGDFSNGDSGWTWTGGTINYSIENGYFEIEPGINLYWGMRRAPSICSKGLYRVSFNYQYDFYYDFGGKFLVNIAWNTGEGQISGGITFLDISGSEADTGGEWVYHEEEFEAEFPIESVRFGATYDEAGIKIGNYSITPVVVDHPTRAELEAATVPHGGYHTCLAKGLIRLGSPPNGEVTADVIGTSPATVPAICKALLLAKADMIEDDLDLSAFSALETANNSEAGIYLTGEETFQEALDLLFGSIGAWYGFDRSQDKLTCGRVELPSQADATLNIETETLASGGVARKKTRDHGDGIPAWRVRLKHTRNWKVQGGGLVTESSYVANNLAGVVSEARRNWLNKEYREAVAETAAVRDKHPLSPELEFETLLLENAAAEAERRLGLYSGARERYELSVPMELLFDPDTGMKVDLGSAVELVSERFGLPGGKTFLVIGMTEIYAGEVDEVTLDLFG